MNRKKTLHICVVDDEDIIKISLTDDLQDYGHKVKAFGDPVEALEFIKENTVDIVITDMRMPKMDGIQLLSEIKKINPEIYVIVMTAYGSVKSAVEAMKLGAYDYLLKPFEIDELTLLLNKITDLNDIRKTNQEFSSQFQLKYDLNTYVGISDAVKEIRNLIKIYAETDSTVLITGETGTGKELIANLIHYNSLRKDKPLVKVSCGILAKDVIESELFGHEKGAFTGADKRRIGRFEKADGGTIYLDDIDDIPRSIQIKLLRVLQESQIERVGSSEPIEIDVRVIASTKADLKKYIKAGKFRDDLYYRLNILPLNLKPLRERKDDILPLFEYFLKVFTNGAEFVIENEVKNVLMNYNWPGNIRELKNIAERLSILCKNHKISITNIPAQLREEITRLEDILSDERKPYRQIMEQVEKSLIKKALQKMGNNKAKAAEYLNLHVSTLKSKIAKFGIE